MINENLIPRIGVVTDIRKDTADVRLSESSVATERNCSSICPVSALWFPYPA